MHPAYVLSGGQSRRFGSDKARALLAGVPQLVQLRSQLQKAGHDVFVVADHSDRYVDLGLDCLVDVQAQSGPLAGLAKALEHHQHTIGKNQPSAAGWLLLVNCDQLAWQPGWYQRLASIALGEQCHMQNCVAESGPAATNAAQTNLWAVAWRDEHWQPLPGMYHVGLQTIVQRRLAAGQLSLQSLLGELANSRLCQGITCPLMSEPGVADFDSDTHPPGFWSYNTPEELTDRLALLHGTNRARSGQHPGTAS